jgi:hypothetical protein
MRSFVLCLLLVGCAAGPDPDDAEAEAAPAQLDGKADAAAFVGLFQSHATHHYNGDIPALQLRSDGTYVRAHCVTTNCTKNLAETDHYDTYVSSSGKSYIRFWSWTPVRDDDGNLTRNTLISDVYEVRTFSHGIQVRKAYSARWQSLYVSSDSLACTSSGGTYSASECACPGNTPGAWASTIFVPGAGGCVHNPGASEDNCDSSDGEWTDDDAAATGVYCLCGYGRFLDDAGSCKSF